MQLLQKLRDSTALSKVLEDVVEAEGIARSLSTSIINFLSSTSPVIAYTYTGLGYVAASLSYWLTVAMSTQSTLIADAEDLSIHVLPYRDDVSTIIFSTGEYSKLFAALQAMRVLNVNYKAYAPEPVDERTRLLAKHYQVEMFPSTDAFKASLVLALATFFAHTKVYRNRLESRGKRLSAHSEEGFACIALSLIEKYTSVLEKAVGANRLVVTSSRILEPSALLLTRALLEAGLDAAYTPLMEILQSSSTPILIAYSSVEDRFVKEIRSRGAANIVELVFNTDPLEANLYLTLIAYFLAKLSRT